MNRFAIQANPTCKNIVHLSPDLRISVITPCLIRVEASSFTDFATQTVWNRDLGHINLTVSYHSSVCTVQTDETIFRINLSTGKPISVTLSDGNTVTDLYQDNLLGTARTLDTINGSTKLEPGIMTSSGASIMDDSKSLLIDIDGTLIPRPKTTDYYIFAYGHDHKRQLADFFRITGAVPLIPKYALGNWWSRYKAYSQDEYQKLMSKFIDRKIPITVATIDMDWHWTDVVDRFGEEAKPAPPQTKEEILFNSSLPGWTGYTWNTELFPDHKQLLEWLHAKNFHITLNVHPSQGVRFFEFCYEAMCQSMGIDPAQKKIIPFDISDPIFVKSYFDDIHHPLADEGIDFWWLDWQQGTHTKIPGLDPLWALNHYHTLDAASGEKRPLILSRYAGLGSHRYPLGFSGDTICTWKSLDFQPYFTANAANAGYTWWSHDIGGDMQGIHDDELYLRWLQFGVFSPINRLHSSNSEYMGKEPWKRCWAVNAVAEQFLRLRHKMIPYLYSANYQTHVNGIPIVMPMYYNYPCENAHQARNEYIFGGQLLVCPITQPANARMHLAYTDIWLPKGKWTDIFNGRKYMGGKWVRMYRDIDSIPVLAGEGSIVPMYHSAETNDLSLDQPLDIHIWYGNGNFSLYEDDGESNEYRNGVYTITEFHTEANQNELLLTIDPPRNSFGLLPEKRSMNLLFRDIASAECAINGEEIEFADSIPLTVGSDLISVHLKNIQIMSNPDPEELRIDLFTRVQGSNRWKSTYFTGIKDVPDFVKDALAEFNALC